MILNRLCKTFSVGDAESVSVDTCGKLDELEKIYRGSASAAADRDHSDEETGGGEEVEEASKRRGTPSAAGNVFSLTGKSQVGGRGGGVIYGQKGVEGGGFNPLSSAQGHLWTEKGREGESY